MQTRHQPDIPQSHSNVPIHGNALFQNSSQLGHLPAVPALPMLCPGPATHSTTYVHCEAPTRTLTAREHLPARKMWCSEAAVVVGQATCHTAAPGSKKQRGSCRSRRCLFLSTAPPHVRPGRPPSHYPASAAIASVRRHGARGLVDGVAAQVAAQARERLGQRRAGRRARRALALLWAGRRAAHRAGP